MCGRFTLRASPVDLAHLFGLAEVPPLEPRYNIAPTQTVFAVRVNEDGKRAPVLLKWGLIPSWADDHEVGYRMIDARSERAADKPAFRPAFRGVHGGCNPAGGQAWRLVDPASPCLEKLNNQALNQAKQFDPGKKLTYFSFNFIV
jgi:hypothetical protein